MASGYQPSAMTQALGLQAYDYRHRDSVGTSGGSESDDGSSDSEDGDTVSNIMKTMMNNNGNGNNENGTTGNGDAITKLLNGGTAGGGGDAESDSDDSTKFDEGDDDDDRHYNERDPQNARGSSLRMSCETWETSANTIMTGDHVGALLRAYEKANKKDESKEGDSPQPPNSAEVDLLGVYEEEGLPKRWADSASGGMDSNNPYFNGIMGGTADGGESDEDGERLTDSGRQHVVPQVRMTRHEFGSSLVTKNTKDTLYDLVEEMYEDGNKEDDDGAEERAGGELGTNNYARVHLVRTKDPSDAEDSSGSAALSSSVNTGDITATMDNRAMNKLLWDNEGDDDDDSEEDEEGGRVTLLNLQSGLNELKDNLAEKATQLGDMLKGHGYGVCATEGDPTDEGPLSVVEQAENKPEGPDLVGKRPVLRQASGGDDDAAHVSSNQPVVDTVPDLQTSNEGRQPINRRGTVESESMWTAVTSAFNRQASAESQTTAGSGDAGGVSNADRGGSGANRPIIIDEESPRADQEEMQRPPSKRRSSLDSWMSLDGVLTGTPFVADDGTPIKDGDADDAYDGEEDAPLMHYRPGQRTMKRCIGVTFAIAVAVVGAALIGMAINDSRHDAYDPIPPDELGEGLSLKEEIENMAKEGDYTKEALFKMATSVDEHCHSEQLKTAMGRWECQQICHDHFCCFDVDQGGAKDAVDSYNCRKDPKKLCSIFAGCEALVLQDFLESAGGTIEEYHQKQQGSTNGGATVTSLGHGGDTSETAKRDDEIHQELTADEDLGWMEVRRKYVSVYCEASHVQSKQGRRQCQNVCENHFCCFDTPNSCRDDRSMTCDVYAGCSVILAEGLFDDPTTPKAKSPPGPEDEPIPIPPDMTGEHLEPLAFDNLPPVPASGAADDDDDRHFAFEEISSSGASPGDDGHTYNPDELYTMTADVKERCRDYRSPTGRLQCEKICQFHHCCFDNSGEPGCRENPAKLCDVYDSCKVLMGTGLSYASPADDIKEEEKHPANAAIVSTEELELEAGGGDEQTPYWLNDFDNDYGMLTGNGQQDEGDDGGEEPEPAYFEIDETLRPTPERTPPPTPRPTPKPTLPTAANRPAQVSKATGKPPPPPPIRCIPQGDDEVHTEVYADDWNDDRYDRCKRWERKHGMTIGEYWDAQGINSALEKNILGNMLIMESGKSEGAARDEGEGLPPKKNSASTPLLEDFPDDLDELDDLILGFAEDDGVEEDDMLQLIEDSDLDDGEHWDFWNGRLLRRLLPRWTRI